MARLSDLEYLKMSCELSKRAREKGNHPFGAILVHENGEVVMEGENTCETEHDATGHAETNLAKFASRKFEKDYLAKCTMFTSVEPCAMCSGALYWTGIGSLVFGITEHRLLEMTGNHSDNPTMESEGCRHILEMGQRDISVTGPINEIEEDVLEAHKGFWD